MPGRCRGAASPLERGRASPELHSQPAGLIFGSSQQPPGPLPPSLRQVAGEEQREERNAKRASGEQTAPAGLLRSELDAPACSSGALLARFHQHFRVPFHVTHSSAAPRGGVPFSFADVAPGFSPARAALKGGATGQYPGRIALTRPECLTTCHCSQLNSGETSPS